MTEKESFQTQKDKSHFRYFLFMFSLQSKVGVPGKVRYRELQYSTSRTSTSTHGTYLYREHVNTVLVPTVLVIK